MFHRVALVRTDVSEELRASIIRVTRIGEILLLHSLDIIPDLEADVPHTNFIVVLYGRRGKCIILSLSASLIHHVKKYSDVRGRLMTEDGWCLEN
jgi:hypothetical protein